MRTPALALLLSLLSLPACAQVTTFDFNERPRAWSNMAPIDGRGTSEWIDTGGRTGGALHISAEKGVPSDGIRMWKTVLSRPAPPAGRRLHVRAWFKGKNVETVAGLNVRAGTRGDAHVAGFASSQEAFPLKGTFDWTEVHAALDVPRGALNVQVHLLLVGSGEIWVDDVSAEIGEEVQLIVPGLFVVRGEAKIEPGTCSVVIPLPRDDADQAVVGYSVRSEPPATACRILHADDGAPGIEVDAPPGTTLSWDAIVLVGPTDSAGLPEQAPAPETWPPGVREWVQDGVRAEGDVLEIIRSVTQSDAPADHTPQGCLAKLRAAGVPARLVLGAAPWAPAQEQARAIVEAYVPTNGWLAIEPTLGRGAWPNHQFIRLRLVPRADEETVLASWKGVRAEPLRNFSEAQPADWWRSTLDHVRASWRRRLQRDDVTKLGPEHPLRWFQSGPLPAIERLLVGDGQVESER